MESQKFLNLNLKFTQKSSVSVGTFSDSSSQNSENSPDSQNSNKSKNISIEKNLNHIKEPEPEIMNH